MPWSCFGKKDKNADGAADKYTSGGPQEPLCAAAPGPALTQAPAPAPAQTEPAPATPPTPVTPTSSDARLRPEDDPDKASRRRDVVASFYSDQCELIGFKATGSRPPSAVGGGGEGPAATSSPLGSSRTCALSRADLALKRREFFKDLAVNDLNSSRYGSSEPSWRLVDSGSLTTPRRPYQDSPHHHTLPLQARYGGLILRPVNSPAKGTSNPNLHVTNGDSGHDYSYSQEQRTDVSKAPEEQLLLGGGSPWEPVAHHPEAGAEEPLLSQQHSGGNQSILAVPVTPPATPTTSSPTPPPRVEPMASDILSYEQPLVPEAPLQETTTGTTTTTTSSSTSSTLVVQQQQYVQQVSVPSDDERLGEGSCILIEEAFPGESPSPVHTVAHDVPDTTSAPGSPLPPPSPPPPATHQAAQDVPQHSSEQPTTTEPPSPRRDSLPEEDGEREELLRLTSEGALDTDQDLTRPTSSPETSTPGSPQELRQACVEAPLAAAPPDPQHHHQDSLYSQQENEEARLSPTIVGCIPKEASTQESDPRPPSPPHTPTATAHPSPPPAGEETCPPATPATPPTSHDPPPPSPPTPPSLTEGRVTCGVEVSSSSLQDDGLGSDIDDALSSLECLTEEGNNEKRATAST